MSLDQNTTSKPKNYGIYFVLLAGICWGIISIFVRNLTAYGLNSLQIICLRACFSTVMLLLYFLIKDPKLLYISLKDIWMFIGSGLLSLTFFSFCYFTTIINCGAAIGVILLYTSPIFVTLLSIFIFKEKLNKRKILSLLLTFTGCILVTGIIGGSGAITFSSFVIGLGSGLGYALYSVFAGIAVRKYSSLTVTFYTMLTSSVSLLLISNPVFLFNVITIDTMPFILGIAFICTVIPYISYTAGLKLMDKSRAAIIVTIEPLVGCLLGILAFKEPIDVFKSFGMLLILIAVILLSNDN